MKTTCKECLGEGYIQCPTCDSEGVVEEEPVQLQIPGVDWSQYEAKVPRGAILKVIHEGRDERA